MTFLPIVARELRTASRHRGTWWVRMGAALVALIIGGWIMLIPDLRTPQHLGIALFVALAIVTYLYCILAGLRTTADCLSEEKREGTLGLLFLTDLRGYDIVFGKLAATSLNAFYGIMAVIPVMAIPILLGGVTVGEFWRVVACALNNMFFSLAVGMFCSSISREESKAMAATLMILVLFSGGLPMLGGLVMFWTRSQELHPLFFIPSPGYNSFLAFDETYSGLARAKFNYFEASFLCVHLMSWALLGLSCYIVPRTWQDRPGSPESYRRKEQLRRAKFGGGDDRGRMRSRLLEINPYYWLASRDRFKPALVWGLLGFGGLWWLYGLSKYPSDWKTTEAYVTTTMLAYVAFSGWIAGEAGRRFALDKKCGALELILSTPISVGTILRGQWAGLQRQFLNPLLVVWLAMFLFMFHSRNDTDMVLFWVVCMVLFVLDTCSLACMGMWSGLSTGNIRRSSSKGIFLIMLLPWVVWGGLMTTLATMGFFSQQIFHSDTDWIARFLILTRMAVGLTFDFLFGFKSWQRLRMQFRLVATQPVVGGKWQRFFRSSPAGQAP